MRDGEWSEWSLGRRSALPLVIGLATVLGCSDAGFSPRNGGVAAAFVSAPMHRSGSIGQLGIGPQSDSTRVYVSMSPGRIPSLTRVTVENTRNGAVVTPVVAEGGFDPVAITGEIGDTLRVAMEWGNGQDSTDVVPVPRRSSPRVVRTSPPDHKTDVPLNMVVRVVFSQPMDSSSLLPAVTLSLHGQLIAGTVHPVVDARGQVLEATLVPHDPLAAGSSYQLGVSTLAHGLNDEALATAVQAAFATVPRSQLVFAVGPKDHFFGQGLPIEVEVQNQFGQAAVDFNDSVSLALEADLPSNHLFGTRTVAAFHGVAVFGDLTIDSVGAGYRLTASAPGLSQIRSAAFSVCVQPCWVKRAALVPERQGIAMGAVAGRIYAIGGTSRTGWPAEVAIYDPVADRWSLGAPMPTPRTSPAVASLGGLLYTVGGESRTGMTTVLEVYDPATDRWTTRAPMLTARKGLGLGVVNGILYAIGGYIVGGLSLTAVEAYDPVTDRWSARAPLPFARDGFGVGVVNGVLYAVGGSSGFEPDFVQAYDPVADRWTTVAPMPLLSGGDVSVAVIGGTVYAAEGSPDGVTMDKVWVNAYDPPTDHWTTQPAAPLLSGRLGQVGVVDSTLYVVGRQTQAFHP